MAEGTVTPILEAVIGLAPVPMVVADRQGRFLTANRQWQALHLSEEAARPDAWLEALELPGRRRLIEEIEQTAATGGSSSVDLELGTPDGRRWTRWWLQRREVDESVVVVMAVVDVHEDLSQKDDLRRLATRDDLTGLVNRRYFLEAVEQALRRAERFPEPACVLYIDLDGFKSVNDRAGHSAGDRVLGTVAARLRQATRSADVVGRIGGDEFAVLIERLASPTEADVVARRLTDALSGSVEMSGAHWPLSASIGTALSRRGEDSAEELLSRADRAMYVNKRSKGGAAAGAPPGGTPAGTPPTGPGPAGSPPDGTPPDGPRTVDIRSLQAGMECLRLSLEVILPVLDRPAP